MASDNLFTHYRQRAKGVGGEREVRALLSKRGIPYKWMGYAEQRMPGKHPDLIAMGYAIEVKRYANGPFSSRWWDQAQEAAQAEGLMPAVVYRFDRGVWRVRVGMRTEWMEPILADALFDAWLDAAKGMLI